MSEGHDRRLPLGLYRRQDECLGRDYRMWDDLERERPTDANLRVWLEEAESTFGQRIEAIVVGPHASRPANADAKPDENVVLTREQGLAKIDADFSAGHGVLNCFPVYAWTKSWVIFVYEYDGASKLAWVPRNPVACTPKFSGDKTEDSV